MKADLGAGEEQFAPSLGHTLPLFKHKKKGSAA
jgi:hypothetical protein